MTMWHHLTETVRRHHQEFDEETAAWQAAFRQAGGRIFCAAGCAACCTLAVNCTMPEALAVAAALTDPQAGRLASHAARLPNVAAASVDMKDYLRRQRQELGACPFLEEGGGCGVYPVRPLSCRALLSTKEPTWCGLDFATLSGEEKQAFMATLDRSIVAFPLHYVAATQEQGQRRESGICHDMAGHLGCYLYGNLPALVFLEREYRLSTAVTEGRRATMELLARTGLDHPYLVTLGP
jgi:Fe-S-cluster containining protein